MTTKFEFDLSIKSKYTILLSTTYFTRFTLWMNCLRQIESKKYVIVVILVSIGTFNNSISLIYIKEV